MPINTETLSIDTIRHAEYYNMLDTFDELYKRSSRNESFNNLMELVLKRENILLAYRNIKRNKGSMTPGTDGITIKDIEAMTPNEIVENIRYFLVGSPHGYRPKPVRLKEIPKPNGEKRPLGIPCMWDRLIQQCIKQILEPICEAKFSPLSYGFRPLRSVENAISRTYQLVNFSKMTYVIEVDIKNFFGNVNHSKLIKQMWTMGIHDKQLLYIVKKMLTCPIKDKRETSIPTKGTPQGGILSPLLANIVLNECDHWLESQWINHPIALKSQVDRGKKGIDKSTGYEKMRRTKLKQIFFVRYADDIRIFCKTKNEAMRTKHALEQWLKERLSLEISESKTRIVNMKKQYMDFLGFKVRAIKRKNKYVVSTHVSDKQMARKAQMLRQQARHIGRPRKGYTVDVEIKLYNAMVLGMQNYYCLATHIAQDFGQLNRQIMVILATRLKKEKSQRLSRTGNTLSKFESRRYGKSKMLRYEKSTGLPIYPIGYTQHCFPMAIPQNATCYTPEGREKYHKNLNATKFLAQRLMEQRPFKGQTVEYADNRISLLTAQNGKCAITGIPFVSVDEIHCHHIIPKFLGGTDRYSNLILIDIDVHRLIHAKKEETIKKYLLSLNLNDKQIEKVNKLREPLGLNQIIINQFSL